MCTGIFYLISSAYSDQTTQCCLLFMSAVNVWFICMWNQAKPTQPLLRTITSSDRAGLKVVSDPIRQLCVGWLVTFCWHCCQHTIYSITRQAGFICVRECFFYRVRLPGTKSTSPQKKMVSLCVLTFSAYQIYPDLASVRACESRMAYSTMSILALARRKWARSRTVKGNTFMRRINSGLAFDRLAADS